MFEGIAFFFITEAAAKTQDPESGLRFKTIAADLKKPGVISWMLLPSVSGIVTLVLGNLIFSGEFVAHVMGRTGSFLSFDKTALLIGQVTACSIIAVSRTLKEVGCLVCSRPFRNVRSSKELCVNNL